MNVFIRKVRVDDIPDIVAAWKEFMESLRRHNEDYWETKNGEQVFAQYLEDVHTNAHTLVAVAEIDRKLVGFALAYIEEFSGRKALIKGGHQFVGYRVFLLVGQSIVVRIGQIRGRTRPTTDSAGRATPTLAGRAPAATGGHHERQENPCENLDLSHFLLLPNRS